MPALTHPLTPAQKRKLGRRLRDARDRAGLTQSHAGKTSGIGQPALWKIERGIQAATLGQILALAKMYGTKPASLLPTE